MKFYIKYMLCQRCVALVKEVLSDCGFNIKSISIGEIELVDPILSVQVKILKNELLKLNMVLLDDKKAAIIEQIKTLISDFIEYSERELKTNLSDYISERLNYNYTYLANLFSAYEGTTIAHYVIVSKIEKVKELIIYNDMNITEISYKLRYSSVAHLSNQFKKVSGMTPSEFKMLVAKRRGL